MKHANNKSDTNLLLNYQSLSRLWFQIFICSSSLCTYLLIEPLWKVCIANRNIGQFGLKHLSPYSVLFIFGHLRNQDQCARYMLYSKISTETGRLKIRHSHRFASVVLQILILLERARGRGGDGLFIFRQVIISFEVAFDSVHSCVRPVRVPFQIWQSYRTNDKNLYVGSFKKLAFRWRWLSIFSYLLYYCRTKWRVPPHPPPPPLEYINEMIILKLNLQFVSIMQELCFHFSNFRIEDDSDKVSLVKGKQKLIFGPNIWKMDALFLH